MNRRRVLGDRSYNGRQRALVTLRLRKCHDRAFFMAAYWRLRRVSLPPLDLKKALL
jgi:hypothetical protein